MRMLVKRKRRNQAVAALLIITLVAAAFPLNASAAITKAFDKDFDVVREQYPIFSKAEIENPSHCPIYEASDNEELPEGYFNAGGKYPIYDDDGNPLLDEYGNQEYRDWPANQMNYFADGYSSTRAYLYNQDVALSGGFGSPGSATGKGLADYAYSFLGLSENPMGSDRILFTDWYNDGIENGSYWAVAWCVIFIQYCAEKCGLHKRGENDLFAGGAGTDATYDYYKAKGYAIVAVADVWDTADPDYAVQPGDIVFYWDRPFAYGDNGVPANHIGIVYEVGPNNSYIKTIEGNAENKVSSYKRTKIVSGPNSQQFNWGCIVRIPYPSAATVIGPDGTEYTPT